VRRRDLLGLIPGAVIYVREAHSQQMRRIGLLSALSADAIAPELAAFRRGLEETSYIEGQNLTIEYRWANGDYARLPNFATDLVKQNVELIVAIGGPQPAMAAMKQTKTIPILTVTASMFVKHINRPEGNITGANISTSTLMPKRLQILAEMAPGATIGVLMNPTYSQYDTDRKDIEQAAQSLGVKLAFATASGDPDFNSAFDSLVQQHVGALLIAAEPFFASRAGLLISLSARYAIPTMHEWRESVVAGGLISYGPQHVWAYHQVGRYTGQILNAAKPADLPVVAPTKFELVINLNTAKALGLTVPQSLLVQADEVIE